MNVRLHSWYDGEPIFHDGVGFCTVYTYGIAGFSKRYVDRTDSMSLEEVRLFIANLKHAHPDYPLEEVKPDWVPAIQAGQTVTEIRKGAQA